MQGRCRSLAGSLSRRLNLDQSGAEERAKENDSTANDGAKAKVAADQRLPCAASGRRGRGAGARAGATARSSVGSDGSDGARARRGGTGRGTTCVLGAFAGETRALTGALLHVKVGFDGDGGELLASEVGDFPGVALRGALAGLAVGIVAAVAGRCWGVREGRLEGLKVRFFCDAVACDLHETVAAAFLGVFVDETA